jgi:exopolysaccharide biosynthesis operon protein EpsL
MPRSRYLALVIGALSAAAPVLAADREPGFHAYAGLGWGHDDNLLRVPDNLPPFENTRGDSWIQTDAGFFFDNIYSRQRLIAVAKLSYVRFDHFDQLNYNGRDLQATWLWQLGHYFDGRIATTYTRTLAPYTDFYSNQRNLRTEHHHVFEGNWHLHPNWQARVGYFKDKFDYDLQSQRFNIRTENTTELEGDYTPGSGSTVGLVLRRIRGTYPFGRPVGFFIVNSDFKQDELKARVNWVLTGTTTINALAGYARRDQPSFGGSTSGVNGKITALYDPHGKMSYSVSVWRDFAPLESTLVSYTRNKGVGLGAAYAATAKLKVDASAVYERREYNPRQSFPGSNDLRDTMRTASLRATWAARPGIQATAALVHQSRTGSVSLGTGSYTSNAITLNASMQF